MRRERPSPALRRAPLAVLVLLTGAPVLLAAEASPVVSPAAVRARLSNRAAAQAVRRAVAGASERLTHPSCQKVLTAFTDGDGRPLNANLANLGVTPSTYLGLIGFYDGRFDARCLAPSGILAFTAPGHRVVRVCPAFTRLEREDPALAEVIILHEALHSLGLGENPPNSTVITRTVAAHCAAGASGKRAAR